MQDEAEHSYVLTRFQANVGLHSQTQSTSVVGQLKDHFGRACLFVNDRSDVDHSPFKFLIGISRSRKSRGDVSG